MVEHKLGKVKDANITILGLTYKPDTDVIEASASVEIARALSGAGARVKVYDPAGMENAKRILGESVKYANSIGECLQDAEFCLVTTPWEQFKKLIPDDFTQKMKKPVLLDCWRIYDRAEFIAKLDYLAIGLST
jgi:UDPglucose 6-dehydrogenase